MRQEVTIHDINTDTTYDILVSWENDGNGIVDDYQPYVQKLWVNREPTPVSEFPHHLQEKFEETAHAERYDCDY